VEVSNAMHRYRLDLFSHERLNWVFELPLQSKKENAKLTLSVANKKNIQLKGNEVWLQAIYVSENHLSRL
jgi:hypothetical protein